MKAKKIKSYLDMFSAKVLKNHVVVGMVKHTSGHQIDKDIAGNDNTHRTSLLNIAGLKNILPQNMMVWKDEFFVLISSKAFSYHQLETDDHMISETEVPPWFELDTLYMFKADGPNDESDFRKKIPAKDIMMVEPVQDSNFKGKYNIILELQKKVYFIGFETCQEANRWTAALKKAKYTNEEVGRAKGSGLLRNIDNMVSLYKKKVGGV